jgi:hypothetical protein
VLRISLKHNNKISITQFEVYLNSSSTIQG